MQNAKYIATLAFTGLFFLLVITGCAGQGTVVLENEDGRVIIESDGEEQYPERKEPNRSGMIQKIPPGHMPPAGKCRIWYPNRPPGHQPPPGNCEELKYRVPRDAWLVRG